MGSVNRVILVGHLGKDAEVRHLPSGAAVANFTLATTETWMKDGQKQEQTEWHRVALFRNADSVSRYLTKGTQIFVEGRLQTRQWEKDGQKHYTTEIRADRIEFLGGGRGGGERAERGGGSSGYDEPMRDPAPVTDDDIPF